MLKILFYHANDTIQLKAADSSLFLGVSALYLKTYIDINYKDVAKNLDWLVPLQHKITDSELVDIINTEQPDVFCTSHYIWNNSFLFEQIERIKDKIPATIKIIVGGPSVDVNINPTFFEQYSFVDYAIYGSGEQAFADLVAALVSNKKLIKFNTSNVAWTDSTNQKQIVADFLRSLLRQRHGGADDGGQFVDVGERLATINGRDNAFGVGFAHARCDNVAELVNDFFRRQRILRAAATVQRQFLVYFSVASGDLHT